MAGEGRDWRVGCCWGERRRLWGRRDQMLQKQGKVQLGQSWIWGETGWEEKADGGQTPRDLLALISSWIFSKNKVVTGYHLPALAGSGMVLSGFFSRHLLWHLIPAPGGLSRWEISFHSPILGSSSRTGNPQPWFGLCLFPVYSGLEPGTEKGLHPHLLSGRNRVGDPCPFYALCSYKISDNGAPLLSFPLIYAPSCCQNHQTPYPWDSAKVFTQGAAPQLSGMLGKCSG